jgi:hypothetical protein
VACSWLAYAIFHPDTKTSSWRSLVLEHCGFETNACSVLRQKKQNPSQLVSAARLAVSMGVKVGNAVSKIRQVARVLRTTKVYSTSEFTSRSVINLQPGGYGEICGYKKGTVCVLVPGFGFGWIRRDDIAEVDTDMPTGWPCSSLIGFEIIGHVPTPYPVLFVEAIGESLKALRISELNTGDALDKVAAFCPSLTHLEIDGSHRSYEHSIRRFFPRPTSKLENLSMIYLTSGQILNILSTDLQSPAVRKVAKLRLPPT